MSQSSTLKLCFFGQFSKFDCQKSCFHPTGSCNGPAYEEFSHIIRGIWSKDCESRFEPQSPNRSLKKKKLICAKFKLAFPPIPQRTPKSAQNAHFWAQKCAKSAVLRALGHSLWNRWKRHFSRRLTFSFAIWALWLELGFTILGWVEPSNLRKIPAPTKIKSALPPSPNPKYP